MSAQRPTLHLSLVSGRRPDLLDRTLSSFSRYLFAGFELGEILVNLDPFAGDAAAHAACRNVLDRYLPGATVFEPTSASFGAAVKRLWSALPDGVVFHLEDDWLIEEPLPPERVLPLLTGSTKAVVPLSEEHGWDGRSPFKTQVLKTKLLGVTVWRRRRGAFGTSPRFMDGSFARAVAALIDPRHDPEKQMRRDYNRDLARFLRPYRNRLLPADDGGPLIADIGRQWREDRGISKRVEGPDTIWSGMLDR